MNILIVDDHTHILKDLKEELESCGETAYIAPKMEDAKKIIMEIHLDYAIIDLKIDGTNKYAEYGGIEIFQFAKSQQPNLKFLIISASPLKQVEESLIKNNKDIEEVKVIMDQIENDYIYKGYKKGRRSYIDDVLEKMNIDDNLSWHGKYHALLIGVQNYKDKRIKNLHYPISDCLKLNDVLNTYYSFNDKRITILENPNRESILKKLEDYSTLSEKDNLLIFYAGHGYRHSERKQGYWLPTDAQKSEPSKWISNGEISDFLRAINTQHTLLVSDACFSGAIFEDRELGCDLLTCPQNIQRKYSIKSRKAISSGDSEQTVPDKSLFINYLINHLKKNKENYLYAEKLFVNINDDFIKADHSDQNPIYGKILHTGLDKDGGDFIFVR